MPEILFLPAGPLTSASSRYRVFQYLEPLAMQGFHPTVLSYPTAPTPARRLAYFLRLLQQARRADVVFIQKRLFPRFFPLIRRVSRKIVYDFDDAIFLPSHLEGPANRLEERGCTHPLASILPQCDHVIAGNEYLAEYARRFTSHVTVIPTVVDTTRYRVRPRPLAARPLLTLGWVGNGENLCFLEDLAPVFLELMKQGGQRFCVHVISDATPRLPDPIPLHFQPWRLEGEIEDLYAFDIGLMPLRDNPRTRGKCAFKAIQYMAIGIPAVASPVGANSTLIQHGVNGLLAQTTAEWVENLARLMEDEALRARLGQAGRQTIEQDYSLAAALPQMISVLQATTEGR